MTKPVRAVLVDGEPRARERMVKLLAAHPRVEIAGQAGDIGSAAALCERTRPDLIFLDTQLGNASGFDLLEHLSGAPAIIFATAFSEYALRAFEVNALNYLLKPVSPARLASALAPLTEQAANTPPPLPRIKLVAQDLLALPQDSGLRMVPLGSVVSVEAEGNYSQVTLRQGKPALIRRTMDDWEAILPAAQFVRLDRSVIVGLSAVREFHRHSQKTGLLHLAGRPEPLRLGRPAMARLLTALPRA